VALFPDSLKDDEPRPAKPEGPQLPRITVTSSPEDIRRAFNSVSAPSTPAPGTSPVASVEDAGGPKK
jgi:hypothetical protein